MIRQSVTITNPTGLHLRPAGIFCNVASRYQCRVTFEYDDTTANAKSVLSVLGASSLSFQYNLPDRTLHIFHILHTLFLLPQHNMIDCRKKGISYKNG